MSAARLLARRLTLLALGGAWLAGACVSERVSGTDEEPTDGCDVRLPDEAFGSTIVVVRGFAFSPAQVRVRPGTRVTWVNCGAAGTPAHTSTADGGAWDSPLLAPGATYTRDFAAVGAFPYHCAPHPGMRGLVTVE